MLSNLLSNKTVFVIMKSKMSLGVRGERGGKLSTKLREGIFVGGVGVEYIPLSRPVRVTLFSSSSQELDFNRG